MKTKEVLKTMEKILDETLRNGGILQYDKRLERSVLAMIDFDLLIDDLSTEELKKEKMKIKFKEDRTRMDATFLATCKEALVDPDSRRLLVLNTDRFLGDYQCFTSLQFVRNLNKTTEPEFIMIVYQRSGDLVKFKDDLSFFGYMAGQFEKITNYKVNRISIKYAHVHKETKR